MTKKVVCAGHICLDITPLFDDQRSYGSIAEELTPGSLVHMDGVSIHTGGSVANTGLAMKLLGNDVRLMGKVGSDAFGGIIRDSLGQYGTGGLLVEKGARTSYSVVLAIPGMDRIFLHDPGANDSFSVSDIPWDEIEGTALFHFGYPTLMKRMYSDGGTGLSAMFRRISDLGIATSLDMAAVDPQSAAGQADWESILAQTLPWTDFFVPSFEELCYMLDRKLWQHLTASAGDITEGLDLEEYAKPLAERCLEMGCGAVLLKCGISGIYFKTADFSRVSRIGRQLELDSVKWADREGIQPCFKPDIIRSANGAGDVCIAAFLTAVLSDKSPEECAELAAAEGAASVTAYDALSGLKALDELSQKIRSGWETEDKQ